ncbi:MAG: single-stranded-DNA-specific exonuclease RecJ [Candidatus Calescibacterium sp.]|nr:single-stranded-DNA-specific exonuclease RecJ [Candidatus Calescibacterium sp.]
MPALKKRVRWRRKSVDLEVAEKISNELGIPSIVSKILVSRGQNTPTKAEKFLNPKIEDAENPFIFPDMKKASERLARAIINREKIGIFSDADADGISAAAILHNFLTDAGMTNDLIITKVPSRDKEGYGLSKDFIQDAYRNGVKLIITADCGVRNHFEISYAKSLGIDVVVCDHHHMDYSLPESAYAILHPKTIPEESALSFLSGAGVAFELVAGTRSVLRKLGIQTPKPRNYLDILSIGTVGDMVPLIGDNRIFVKYGLDILSQGTGNLGLRALVQRNNLKEVYTYDLQMKIIPRINSSGRAGKPEISFKLLTEQNPKRVSEISDEIEEANQWRKEKVQAILDEIELLGIADDNQKHCIVAYGEDWPEGVVGLVAARLLEKTGKPTCVISVRKDEARGSIRSPDFLNIMGILEKVSPLLRKYGGHAQAAGISLDPDKIEDFKHAFEMEIRKNLENSLNVILDYDDDIVLDTIDNQSIYEIIKLEPFGEGNPLPLFIIDCDIVESKIVGGEHIKLYAKTKNGRIPMIAFGYAKKIQPFVGRSKMFAKLRPSQIDGAEFEVIDIITDF